MKYRQSWKDTYSGKLNTFILDLTSFILYVCSISFIEMAMNVYFRLFQDFPQYKEMFPKLKPVNDEFLMMTRKFTLCDILIAVDLSSLEFRIVYSHVCS